MRITQAMQLKNDLVIDDHNVTLTLPFPPSTNALWAHIILKRKPIRVKTSEYKTYIKLVAWKIAGSGLSYFYETGRLEVDIKLYPPDAARRDVDNYIKGVFDSLTKCHFWNDDSQVKKITIEMCDVVKPAKAVFNFKLLGD